MKRGLTLRLGLVASGALFAYNMIIALAAPAGVTISRPWLRYVAPGVPVAGYFTLNNDSERPVSLDGAISSACRQLTLHASAVQDGTVHMNMVHSVTVPAHGAMTFQPGGYHLMCMSPVATFEPGQAVAVTLQFQDGSSLNSTFPVYGATGQ